MSLQFEIELKHGKDHEQLYFHHREEDLDDDLAEELLPVVQPLCISRVEQTRPDDRVGNE